MTHTQCTHSTSRAAIRACEAGTPELRAAVAADREQLETARRAAQVRRWQAQERREWRAAERAAYWR